MNNKKTKKGKRKLNIWIDKIVDYRKLFILLALNLFTILIIIGGIRLNSFAGRNFVAATLNEPCDGIYDYINSVQPACNNEEVCCNAGATDCKTALTPSYHCFDGGPDAGGYHYDNDQTLCEFGWCVASGSAATACENDYTLQNFVWYGTVTGGSGGSCCGDDDGTDDFYYINTGANPDTCQRCSDGSNNAATNCYQNQVCAADGHLLTVNTDNACDGTAANCICYYDESCAAAAYTAPKTAPVPAICDAGTGFTDGTGANCLVASANTCYYKSGDPCYNSDLNYTIDAACYGSGDYVSSTCYNGSESCTTAGCTDGITDCGTTGGVCAGNPVECINTTSCTTGAVGWVGIDTTIYGTTTSASCDVGYDLSGTDDYCYIDASNACYNQSGDSCDTTKGWGDDAASDFDYVECPDFCFDDSDGGSCAQTARVDPTSAETCYYTDTCAATGCSLTSSAVIAADFCGTCAAGGGTTGDYCPESNASCSSGCSNTGTIWFEAAPHNRGDDCTDTTCNLDTDTLTIGDVWDSNSAATCDETECNTDCRATGYVSGSCVGGASGVCTCKAGPVCSSGCLYVLNSTQNNVTIFDQSGNVFLAGSLTESDATGEDGSDLLFKDSAGTTKAWIDNVKGALKLAGKKIIGDCSGAPAGSFRVNDINNNIVSFISDNGTLCAEGIVYPNTGI